MKRFIYIITLIFTGLMITSCSVTRKIPQGEYFVQRVDIQTDKETPREERISAAEFKKYLRLRENKKFFGTNLYVSIYNLANPEKENGWNDFKRKLGEAPVLLDMTLVERSADNFKNYMDSRGFFSSGIEYEVDTLKKPRKAYITFKARQGRPYIISRLRYDFRDKNLEPIILADTSSSLIKVGDIFDIATLSAERERITNSLKRQGYYNFSVGNIEYIADTLKQDYTVGLKMVIKQSLTGYDEQGNPVMEDNVIYKIRRVNVLPKYDPLGFQSDSTFLGGMDSTQYMGMNIYYKGKSNLRPSVVRNLVPIYEGSTYDAERINNTYDRLMSIGYLKSAKIAFIESPYREDIIDTLNILSTERDTTIIRNIRQGYLDCNVLCTPGLKQSFKIELEGSVTSSFYGLSTTIGYQNRNLFRGAEALDLAFTVGYEYMRTPSAKKRNALEFGVAAGLSFPRFLLPFRTDRWERIKTPRTRVALSVNFQDRPYYQRTLSSASWGYSWNSRKYSSFILRPIDITVIDVAYIDQEFYDGLQNKYLQNSYSSQLIPALSFTYHFNNQLKNLGGNATSIRINAEIAGNLVNGLEHLFSSPVDDRDYYELFGIRYSQYFRIEASVSRKITIGEKSAIAGRLFAGCGVAYGNSEALPMDRLFYAGGSNSMRGWTPRTLGPGTTPTPEDTLYPTQLGDMRLEANLELRFPIWGIFHGATFFDVGNIWFMREKPEEYSSDAVFRIKDFYKGLGFNTGLGLRLDIKFAILRLDWGVRLHDPNQPLGKRWIHNFKWDNMALNFGVGYPF